MHALAILVDDLCGQVVFAHQLFVGMAGCAGFGHFEGMRAATGLKSRANLVRTVTIDADRDAIISLVLQRLAMAACPVTGELVRSEPERIHPGNISMAVTAERRNVLPGGDAAKLRTMIEDHGLSCHSPGKRGRLIVRQWVRFRALVALLAGQRNVNRPPEFLSLLPVATRAGYISVGPTGRVRANRDENQQYHRNPLRSKRLRPRGVTERAENLRHTFFLEYLPESED